MKSDIHGAHLPDVLPDDPLPTVQAWLSDAMQGRATRNPDSLCLATVDAAGRVAARMVLCKALDIELGYLVFYTNYRSGKAADLAQHPRASGVMYWDDLGRQVRLEGAVRKSPASESDAYFAARDRDSQIGAWASDQSEPIASRAAMLAKLERARARFEHVGAIPRPAHWGGYRLWLDAVELWVSGPSRIHDRARWTRTLTGSGDDAFEHGEWRAQRLQP